MKKSRNDDKPLSWQILKELGSRLRKGDRLWEMDPQVARERTLKLANAKSHEEARKVGALYKDKVDKSLLEKTLANDRARARQRGEAQRKEARSLAKAGQRRSIEAAKENRLAKGKRFKPTKGSAKEFANGQKALEKTLKDRQPGQLTLAPIESAFEQLYEDAQIRMLVPHDTFKDPYALGQDLARDARTLNELDVARFLVTHSFPFGELSERFMRESYVPQFNRLFSRLRLCEECWRKFVPADRRDRFCNDHCSARSRNRGLQKKSSGRSAAEGARAKEARFLQTHWKKCLTCQSGQFCATRETRLQREDALSRSTTSYEDSRHAVSDREPEADELSADEIP